ncbi:MAG TPA: hypothetical protein VHP37_01415 [Burkholderiales bacterium]|nr:hypothetical protein [Burkholderiales bacterium]
MDYKFAIFDFDGTPAGSFAFFVATCQRSRTASRLQDRRSRGSGRAAAIYIGDPHSAGRDT